MAGNAPTTQTFAYSHLKEEDFSTGGLRPYARYRDLGFAAATNGQAVAHVIRFVPPCTDEVRQWHTHDIQFQMIYVLKGWIKTEMAGHEPIKMDAGSSWIQPPGIRHRVVDYSDDCEVLEIVLPAEFATHMVDGPAG
ncbi:MAG: cupin domain-containing protein [Hyphomicrobiaceae bacterium]